MLVSSRDRAYYQHPRHHQRGHSLHRHHDSSATHGARDRSEQRPFAGQIHSVSVVTPAGFLPTAKP
jgi:hypothetical protein